MKPKKENNQPLVSIVVSVYNVSDYLEDCIKSILKQVYKNFELLLVNDGSQDDSGKICRYFSTKDSRIKIIEKVNSGLADVRNVGIRYSSGTYITFVDGDDYVSPFYLSHLVELAQKNNSELVQCNLCLKPQELIKEFDFNEKVDLKTSESAFNDILRFGQFKTYACGKLYSSSLFEGILYPSGKLMEDSLTTYKLALRSNKVVVTDAKLYYYRQRTGSILNSDFNKDKLILLDVPNEIKRYVSKLTLPNFIDNLHYYQLRININLLNQIILSSNKNDYDKYIDEILLRIKNIKVSHIDIKYYLLQKWIIYSFKSYTCIFVFIEKLI
ncbi:glycosyltransferase family 2 protein [Limosilactobacillus sp.]|uniref:glycosyltransferase family 2 protein n=1 Tax=Limosilactobacillus sp. TaxID=2773925 RepID=UPI00345EC93A